MRVVGQRHVSAVDTCLSDKRMVHLLDGFSTSTISSLKISTLNYWCESELDVSYRSVDWSVSQYVCRDDANTYLAHESRNDSMENGSLVVKLFARGQSNTLFSSAKCSLRGRESL